MPTPTKGPRLGGSPAHERLMLANLATSLFRHGKITTTETKAKRLRPLAERLVTFAKRGDLHARRQVLTVIHDKDVVYTLFDQIAPRFETRPGGYTRIVKAGIRKGDAAPMAIIELVEELKVAPPAPAKTAKAAARKSAKADAVAALAGDTDADATDADATDADATDADATDADTHATDTDTDTDTSATADATDTDTDADTSATADADHTGRAGDEKAGDEKADKA